MPTLDELLAARPSMSLDELTDAANALLPDYLPGDPVDARVTDTVNARLIRHYASEGVLDAASRDGKRAVYFVDHLLQLLALRRLLADGVSASVIGDALTRLDRDTLRAIAEGAAGTEALAARADPAGDRRARAAAALAEIRARGAGRGTDPLQAPNAPPNAPSAEPSSAPESARSRSAPTRSNPPRSNPPGWTPSPAPTGAVAFARTSPSDRSSDTPLGAPSRWERVPLLDGVELHVRSDVRLPDGPAARQRLLDHVIREIVLYAQRRGS